MDQPNLPWGDAHRASFCRSLLIGSSGWAVWKNHSSRPKSSSCRRTLRRNGPVRPFPWTLKWVILSGVPTSFAVEPGLISSSILTGSFRSFWIQSPLLESLRAQAQLLRSRCYQMGSLHWTKRVVRDSLLNVKQAAKHAKWKKQPSHSSSMHHSVFLSSSLSAFWNTSNNKKKMKMESNDLNSSPLSSVLCLLVTMEKRTTRRRY